MRQQRRRHPSRMPAIGELARTLYDNRVTGFETKLPRLLRMQPVFHRFIAPRSPPPADASSLRLFSVRVSACDSPEYRACRCRDRNPGTPTTPPDESNRNLFTVNFDNPALPFGVPFDGLALPHVL